MAKNKYSNSDSAYKETATIIRSAGSAKKSTDATPPFVKPAASVETGAGAAPPVSKKAG